VPLPASAQRVQDELNRLGLEATVVELDQSTRSAGDAAAAVGCALGQIAKSLVFQGKSSGKPILVITSGVHRVDEAMLSRHTGESIGRASAEFVREATGFAIGGVPPVAHASPLTIYFDETLLEFQRIWAAAGTPRALFEVDPARLLAVTGAESIRVA
jgi:prolyl-tRNA editing enzyme YbaK/EbsC (Cys-tRNA(Pro) deacylase)